jgi:hypothetical protein
MAVAMCRRDIGTRKRFGRPLWIFDLFFRDEITKQLALLFVGRFRQLLPK